MKYLILAALLAFPLTGKPQTGNPTTLYVATGDVTVANTTAATTLMGAGQGMALVPAGSMKVNRTYRITMYGYFGTAVVAPTTICTLKLGNSTLSTVTLTSLVGSLSQQSFSAVYTFTCRSTGTAGTVMGQGSINYAINGSAKRDDLKMVTPMAVNTTVDNALDVVIQFGTASATNSVTRTNLILEALN